MLIDKIAALCKKEHHAKLYDERDKDGRVVMQWLSNGRAVYPLFSAPYFDTMSLAATFNLNIDKIHISHDASLPGLLNFGAFDDNEKVLPRIDLSIGVGGMLLRPYVTQQGVAYLDEKLLTPLKDAPPEQVQVFERYTAGGGMYFAVKNGLELCALILPQDEVIAESLVNDLDILMQHTATALFNKQRRGRDMYGTQ